MPRTAAGRRVYLHVGVPKSGTSFLQAALARNRKALRDSGFRYPGGREPMFRAALDVRGNHKAWGRDSADVAGSWDDLCRKARAHDGVTVISSELLAAATSRQVAAARSMLTGLEVHVVVTARDLARQLTAEWQEGIKHGRSASFEQFRERILSGARRHEHARKFWASQDLPEVLARWGDLLPPECVHVVCSPSPSSDPLLLWRRFADVVGFDPDAYDPSAPRSANTSLGVTQIHLLRQVNRALDGRLVQPGYGRVVKQYFTRDLLVEHPSPRPEVPAGLYDELVATGERWVKEIERAGYRVHGDLAELVPRAPEGVSAHPDDTDPRVEAATGAAVIAELLVEVDRLRSEIAGLEATKAELEAHKKAAKKKRKRLKRQLADAMRR